MKVFIDKKTGAWDGYYSDIWDFDSILKVLKDIVPDGDWEMQEFDFNKRFPLQEEMYYDNYFKLG